jgi:hypothetical protein
MTRKKIVLGAENFARSNTDFCTKFFALVGDKVQWGTKAANPSWSSLVWEDMTKGKGSVS